MTECNRKTLHFSSLSRNRIQAHFDGGHLTTDGGALLLREVNRRTGLIDALTSCISDPREPAKVKHDVKIMLAQRVYGIAMGYEDGNDHETLRHDPIMQMLSESPPDPDDPLASPSTLCRFENWVNRESLARMSGVLVDQFIASYRRRRRRSFSTSMPPTTPSTVSRRVGSSMASTITTASCRFTYFAVTNSCVPICGRARSMLQSTRAAFSTG